MHAHRLTFVLALLLAPAAGADPAAFPTDPHARIAALEDARDLAAGEWREFCSAPAPEVRAHAARALGRILKPAGINPLLALLADASAPVREAAVWSLGQFGFLPVPCGREGEIVEKLRPLVAGPDDGVRAHAAEALGKIAGPAAPLLVAPLLHDASPRVRIEAALACFRWRQALRMRGVTGDLPALPTQAVDGLLALASDPDPEVRWRAVYVFSRLPEWRAVAMLTARLQDAHPWARLFAARGLAVAKAVGAAPAIAALTADAESSVRIEAVNSLVALGKAELIPSALTRDASPHVRAALAAAGCADFLAALADDPSPAVRAAAIAGTVKVRRGPEALVALTLASVSPDWLVREAVATAAGELGADGVSLLEIAQKDADERVRAAALEAAAGIEGPQTLALLKRGLAAAGLAERGTAVDGLSKRAEPEAWDLLVKAYADCAGHSWTEVREGIADAAKDSKRPEATDFLRRILAGDPEASVQAKAAAALKAKGVTDLVEPAPAAFTHSPHAALSFAKNPVVTLETTRGNIVIECFAQDAPVHTANFVGLAKQGFYDGLEIHRVVPNFVIQGGDPLRNGWGDAGWALRAEINEQRYERGTLGMPRSAGFDTGGCQIFITNIPTPHLDGLYTVFGRVVEGLEVVDRIERGDAIVKAGVRE